MKIKDERVVQLNNKIQSEAYVIVLFLMMVSVFVKSNVLDMPFSNYIVELTIVILSVVYCTLRSVFMGNDFMTSFKHGKLSTMSIVLLSSLAISIINGIANYVQYGDKYSGVLDSLFISVLVVTFISSAIFLSLIFVILYFLNIKGQQRIEKKINKDDN